MSIGVGVPFFPHFFSFVSIFIVILLHCCLQMLSICPSFMVGKKNIKELTEAMKVLKNILVFFLFFKIGVGFCKHLT